MKIIISILGLIFILGIIFAIMFIICACMIIKEVENYDEDDINDRKDL